MNDKVKSDRSERQNANIFMKIQLKIILIKIIRNYFG